MHWLAQEYSRRILEPGKQPLLMLFLGFVVAFLFIRLTVRPVGWRMSLPGAAFAAVCWYALQLIGTALVAHNLQHASRTYGTFK